VKVKENALEVIRNDLRRKVKKGVIGTGSMSDPYNPLETSLKLTRHSLELINVFNFGVSPCTKSTLITRDVDVLADIKTHSPVLVKISITTADDELCRKLEPNVSVSSERVEAMQVLSSHGIFCGTLMIPILPFINDTEDNIVKVVRMTKEAGGKFVYSYMGMTLRQGSREYYLNHLDKWFPGVKDKYMKQFSNRYNCASPQLKMLWNIFTAECERLGLLYDMRAITSHYKMGYNNRQLTLF
jgi:DNA repair photolyase